MLMTVTQQAGNGINGLLDTVFSFLQRRTDFFYEAEPGDKMGFPPQYAEGLVSESLQNDTNLCRSISTSKSTKLSTRRSTHPRVKLSRRNGRNSKKIRRSLLKWRKNRPTLHRLKKNQKRRSKDLLKKKSLLRNKVLPKKRKVRDQLKSKKRWKSSLTLRLTYLPKLAHTTELRLQVTIGHRIYRESMSRCLCHLALLQRCSTWSSRPSICV